MRGDSADVKKIGFSAYLTKPIRRSHLFDCLALVFGRKKGPGKTEASIITRHSVSEARKKNIKILIAEDNIINQKLAMKLMEKFGYKADAVANGEEAIRSLSMIPYNLVLMDVQMPEMDGYQATRIIRDPSSKVINHDIPVIAMTAHAMSGDRKLCLDAGMDDYVAKPINPEELLKTINL
jgi:CheY-like chemotaxis protein